mgnify:CR=1 FL=1
MVVLVVDEEVDFEQNSPALAGREKDVDRLYGLAY